MDQLMDYSNNFIELKNNSRNKDDSRAAYPMLPEIERDGGSHAGVFVVRHTTGPSLVTKKREKIEKRLVNCFLVLFFKKADLCGFVENENGGLVVALQENEVLDIDDSHRSQVE
jgi:hypothetical protein